MAIKLKEVFVWVEVDAPQYDGSFKVKCWANPPQGVLAAMQGTKNATDQREALRPLIKEIADIEGVTSMDDVPDQIDLFNMLADAARTAVMHLAENPKSKVV